VLWASLTWKLDWADGSCNSRRAVSGLEDRPDMPAQPDLFLIHVVLGLVSDGMSLSGLRLGRPNITRWSDVAGKRGDNRLLLRKKRGQSGFFGGGPGSVGLLGSNHQHSAQLKSSNRILTRALANNEISMFSHWPPFFLDERGIILI
jgi:hypothetical protein